MLAGVTSGDIATGVAAVVGFVGVVYGTVVARRWRQVDADDKRWQDTALARVQDSKNALDAWMAISASNATQIAGLSARVDMLQAKVLAYEADIIPQLKQTVEDQADTLAECVRIRNDQERTIAALLERIRRLEENP
jgi:hypothetical protein